jgi:AraC-like DNA-binding protein
MDGSQFFVPDPRLAEVVAVLWDVDVTDAEQARAATIKVLPTTSPLLIIHYRTSMGSNLRSAYRRIASGIQTRTVTVRADGAIGGVLVRLKAQAACRVFGRELAALTDTTMGLDDIFGDAEMSRLEQMLAEAKDARERVTRVEQFLLAQISARQSDPIVERAMLGLQRNPAMSMTRLAARLDICERHLRRRFNRVTGAGPKLFARVARVEKIIAARVNGGRWGDIAYAAGYNDQAHLVNEFRSLVGEPPEAFFRGAMVADYRGVNGFLARSVFSNTFVT